MTQEDKQLLMKDLCARLPYGVIVDYKENEFEIPHWKITTIYPDTFDGWIGYNRRVGAGSESGSRPFKIGEFKPYLRPMSSMSEEEKLHVELTYGFFYHDGVLDNVHIFEAGGYYDRDGNYDPPCEYRERRRVTIEKVFDFIHWLNVYHFDYRGLIPMGLALEAPEGMYKTE